MADSSSGHDEDASGRGFHQRSDRVDPLEASSFAAGSEDSIHSGLTNALQCTEDIRRHVKGTVKCNGERFRQFHQLLRMLDIDIPFRIEDAEHNSVSTQVLRGLDVAAHDLHFLLGITEIAGSRANDGM